MDINYTLVGQMLTFAIFVWFTMRFVWPILQQTMEERNKKIADGLAAAERGHQELKDARSEGKKIISEARAKATEILNDANKNATLILEHAKKEATEERDNIIAAGDAKIKQEFVQARQKLQSEVVNIAVAGAEKLIQRSIKDADQEKIINDILEDELKDLA